MLGGGMTLQPISVNVSRENPASQNSFNPATSKQPLGATWATESNKVNIDLDDLFGTKSPKSGPPPSMNQLKSIPSSPVHNSNGQIQSPTANINPNVRQFPTQPSFGQNLQFTQIPTPVKNNFPQQQTGFSANNTSVFSNNNNGNMTNTLGNANANILGGFNQFGGQVQSNQQQFFQGFK